MLIIDDFLANGAALDGLITLCLNAGAAIYIAGKAQSMEEGVRMAEKIIDDGNAMKKLEQFIEESRK